MKLRQALKIINKRYRFNYRDTTMRKAWATVGIGIPVGVSCWCWERPGG